MSLANKEHPRTGKPHLVMRGGYWVAVERQANDCWGDVLDKSLAFVMLKNSDTLYAEGLEATRVAREYVAAGDHVAAKPFYKRAVALFEESSRLYKGRNRNTFVK
jgi:hypothetical protein